MTQLKIIQKIIGEIGCMGTQQIMWNLSCEGKEGAHWDKVYKMQAKGVLIFSFSFQEDTFPQSTSNCKKAVETCFFVCFCFTATLWGSSLLLLRKATPSLPQGDGGSCKQHFSSVEVVNSSMLMEIKRLFQQDLLRSAFILVSPDEKNLWI